MEPDVTPTKNVKECNQCREEIRSDAHVCYHCGSKQSRFWGWLAIVPMIMVTIAAVQVLLAFKEKIETSQMLKEVEIIKSKADATLEIVEERERFLSKRLEDVSTNIDSLDQRLEQTIQDITKKQEKLSGTIEGYRNTAQRHIADVVKSVNRQADNSRKRLKKTESDFKSKQKELNSQLLSLRKELSIQLDKLLWRDEITSLADEAISYGYRSSYENLNAILKEIKEVNKKRIVIANILRIKAFYITAARYSGTVLNYKNVSLDLKDLSTLILTKLLLTDKPISVRVRAATYLRRRREKGVPDALIKAMKEDDRLDVVSASIRSFAKVTGYHAHDALEYKKLIKWWEKNKGEVEAKLNEMGTEQKRLEGLEKVINK